MLSALISLLSQLFFWFSLSLSPGGFPRPLSAAEERECFEALLKGERAARDELIRRNLRLVAHVTKRFLQNGAEFDDLISTGTIGLIKAVDSFDYKKGTRFATYAARCIENAILS